MVSGSASTSAGWSASRVEADGTGLLVEALEAAWVNGGNGVNGPGAAVRAPGRVRRR